ncbi:hypothetical protein [Streptomyces sp. MS2.AVA.5]|uniref:Uncharacterized protein n=1 Tax=Streptomyces achmelvichensis TaxID=3134111 RepID=A0ACC6PKI7_9ACTN
MTVDVLDDGEPVIAEADQKLLLAQGLTLALHICHLGRSIEPPLQIRCVVSASTTNGTFRFHRIRAGQQEHHPNLDRYTLEKMIVIDTGSSSSPLSGRPRGGKRVGGSVRGRAPCVGRAASSFSSGAGAARWRLG